MSKTIRLRGFQMESFSFSLPHRDQIDISVEGSEIIISQYSAQGDESDTIRFHFNDAESLISALQIAAETAKSS
jgi:hypothetical protein